MNEIEDVDALSVGSLYSGIGGWDLGFTLAGWTLGWQCEINPYRRAVLEAHWPSVPHRFHDGTSPHWVAPHVDALVAACPNQTWLDGDPVHDWVWTRIAQATPVWVVIETAPGHPADLNHAMRQLVTLGFDVSMVPAAFGSTEYGVTNWFRYLLIGCDRQRVPIEDGIRALVMGADVQLASGTLTEEAGGGYRIHYGSLNDTGIDKVAAYHLSRAFGYPADWLLDGPDADVTCAVRDSTAVPVAVEIARLLTRPQWKL